MGNCIGRVASNNKPITLVRKASRVQKVYEKPPEQQSSGGDEVVRKA